jgi:hypothetical protein
MNKEFVPYEEALSLKEFGFDEPCFGFFYKTVLMLGDSRDYPNPNKENFLQAPTFSQAFRWFREKYNITQTIARDGSLAKEGHWAYTIVYDGIYFNDGYLTYEEAELACLKKLIQIVKTHE